MRYYAVITVKQHFLCAWNPELLSVSTIFYAQLFIRDDKQNTNEITQIKYQTTINGNSLFR